MELVAQVFTRQCDGVDQAAAGDTDPGINSEQRVPRSGALLRRTYPVLPHLVVHVADDRGIGYS
jgi:hypothetical protein